MNTDQHDLKGALPFTLSFDDAPVGMSYTALDGRFLRVNRRLCEITGYTADELLHMDFQTITHPDDVMADVHKHQQALAGLVKTYRLDKRYIRKNGSSVWVNITITLVRDERGEPSYSFGVVEDGLKREQSQAQRQDVTIGLRKVLAATNQLMACPTTDSMLKLAVEFARNTLGLERCAIFFQREGYIEGTYGTDAEGNTTVEHEIRVDLNDQWPQQVAQLQADGAQWLMVDNRKHTEWDGEHLNVVGTGWVVITLIPIANGPKCYMFNDTHISNAHIDETQQEIVAVFCSLLGRMIERRQVEEALHESETRLQQAVQAANIGIFEHDHLTDKIFWSRVQRNIFGWTSEESKGLNDVLQTIYPDDQARIKHAVQKAHDPHGDGIYDVEYRIVADDGSIRWLSVHSLTTFEGEGDQRRPHRTVGATADITDRRKVEEALRESEQMLRNILDSIPVRVFWKDLNLRISGCNQHFAQDLGFASSDELIGKLMQDLIPDQSPEWLELTAQYALEDRNILATGEPVLGFEEQQLRGDHSIHWIRNNKMRMRNADGNIVGLLFTYEDITERKIAEMALQKKREEEQEFQGYLKTLHEINIELTMIDNLDDFYRRIVELGLTRLGFDRISLWLYDAEHGIVNGTYGTDLHGQIQREAHLRRELNPSSAFWESLQKPERFMYDGHSNLFHNFEVAGTGRLVTVALWQGHRNIGWLSVDNLINHRPISRPQLEILAQYGMQVGTLLARKQIKEALLESEIFLKKSQSVGKLGSYYFNVDTGDWVSSPMLYELFGIDEHYPKTLTSLLDLAHPSQREELRHALSHDALAENRHFDQEFRIIRQRDGQERWMHGLGELEYDDQGRIVRMIGTVQDISARKQVETALRESEQMLQNVLNTIPVRVFWKDLDLRLRGCNQAFVNDARVSSAEHLLGKTDEELLPANASSEQATKYRLDDQHVLDTGLPLSAYEEPQVRADGKRYWLRTSKVPLRSAEGAVIGVLGTYEDITERKLADERLRESEVFLRKSQTVGRIGSFDFNVITGTWVSSPMLDELFGIDAQYPKTMAGLLSLIAPAHREELRLALGQSLLVSSRHFDKEFRIIRPSDGQDCWMHGLGELEPEPQDGGLRMIGTFQDISARKRVETALRESEQMLHNVLNTIPVRVFWKDVTSKLLGCNRAYAEDSGVTSPEELIGHTDDEIPTDPALIAQGMKYRGDDQRVIETGQPLLGYEEPQLRIDGKQYWLRTSKVPLRDLEGKIIGVLGTYEDITERKYADERLRESERRLNEAQRLAHVGYWDWLNNPSTIAWSDETSRILGLDPKLTPPTYQEILELIHPDDRKHFMQAYAEMFNSGKSFTIEYRVLRSDGSMRYVYSTSNPSVGADGKLIGLFGTLMDITERKQSQLALQRINQRLSILREIDHRILVAHSPMALASTVLDQLHQLIPYDWAGIVLYNPDLTEERVYALQYASGISVNNQHSVPIIKNETHMRLKSGQSTRISDLAVQDEPLTKLAEKLLAQGAHASMTSPMLAHGQVIGALALASKQIAFFTTEHQQISEDIATQIAIALHQASLSDQIARHNAELEERVRERTAELQQVNDEIKNFAYIVSHDLRAPLVNLKGFAAELNISLNEVESLCGEVIPMLPADKSTKLNTILKTDIPESLRFIDSSASQMDGFTKAILKLSRLGRSTLDLIEVDPRSIVDKVLTSLGYQINQAGIKLYIDPLPMVVTDYLSLEQIFGNILTNAVTYLDPQRPGEIRISGEVTDKETIFRIRDNGRGIAKEDMDKVFAPFRRAGKHTTPGEGMGLAYVQTLVRRHGGQISCVSELGVGTTFTFTIARQLAKEIKQLS